MKKKLNHNFNTLYWHQFALIASMVLLTLFLLGISFFGVSYRTTTVEKRSEMRTRAELIAQMSGDYLKARTTQSGDLDEALRNLAGVASRMTDVDFLICDVEGHILLTTDESLAGKVLQLPAEITDAILGEEHFYEGVGTIGGAYESKQFASGVPIYNGQSVMGMVLSVTDRTELFEMWRSFLSLFVMVSAIIMMISFVASSLMSYRQIRPIEEMVAATRAYAEGNFDVRMTDDAGRGDEIGELARSFNAMADSLAQTERQRRDFIANVSHELKTPMTTIAGYTDGILDGTIPPEKEKHYLQIISDESRRLSRLVRRMLDVSQLQSQELRKANFDLCESMRIALLSMEQKITDRGLDVEAQIPEDPVIVRGDKTLITQVVYNLLENAAKFATAGTGLYLGLQMKETKAVVTVRNRGTTIPPEEIPLLFERFHKSDKSRSEDKDGYGLGLYVVKTILSQHKEEIVVTSEDGVTTFAFTMSLSDRGYIAQ